MTISAAPMQPVRVAIVTNVIPHYRRSFYRELFGRPEVEVTVYCQAAIPGMNLRTVHAEFEGRVRLVSASVAPRERLGWQHLPWRELLNEYDVLFVYANPRILSNVLFASWAALRGKAVVLWGPARSAGAGGLGGRLRLLWWRRFRALFVYTDREVEWLRHLGFTSQVIAGMNNGLDQRLIDRAASGWSAGKLREWRVNQGLAERPLILSCARLERKNEFELWLAALPAVLRAVPSVLWCVIGDGAEADTLRARAARLGVCEHIRWLGSIHEESELAPWFLSAAALVHPSAVGLSLLHAFGYGLPVITHDDPGAQMPEYAAFTAGTSGVSYRRGDADDLARATVAYLSDATRRDALSAGALRVAREQYNVTVMADRFADVALRVAPRRGANAAAGIGSRAPEARRL